MVIDGPADHPRGVDVEDRGQVDTLVLGVRGGSDQTLATAAGSSDRTHAKIDKVAKGVQLATTTATTTAATTTPSSMAATSAGTTSLAVVAITIDGCVNPSMTSPTDGSYTAYRTLPAVWSGAVAQCGKGCDDREDAPDAEDED